MRILVITLLLSIAVTVHECGHYAAMRLNGIKVVEVGIGFGPTLFAAELPDGAGFKLKLFPLGGYTEPKLGIGPGTLESASLGAKLTFGISGMLANAIFALLCFLYVYDRMSKIPFGLGNRVHGLPGALQPLAAGVLASFGQWLAMPVIIIHGLLMRRGFLSNFVGPIGLFAGTAPDSSSEEMTVRDSDRLPFDAVFAKASCSLGAAIAGCNFLPLHPLDGGMLVGLLIEACFGPAAVTAFRAVTCLLFLMLVAAIIWSDVFRIFRYRRRR